MAGAVFNDARSSRLNTIAGEIRECKRCDLHKGRKKAVPGEGSGQAKIMLVGEAPGREEDIQGRPFVGRSGKVLDVILEKAGLRRRRLFITSVVKCRPPLNRVPRRREWETCIRAHLWRQIEVIHPVIICILGGVAAKALLGVNRISKVRGEFLRYEGHVFFPTYHPAAAGRSLTWSRAFLEDMKKLSDWLQSGSPLP